MKDNWMMVVCATAFVMLFAGRSWAGSNQRDVAKDSHSTTVGITTVNNRLSSTHLLYNRTLKRAEIAGHRLASKDPNKAQVVPESNTMVGFGTALALNGLGIAGTGYYLRRRYNRTSAMRYADRQAVRLPMFMDTALSMLVLLAVSPVLIAISAAALKSGNPRVYERNKLNKESNSANRKVSGAKQV